MAITLTDPRLINRAEQILTPKALVDLEDASTPTWGNVIDAEAFRRCYQPASELIADTCLSEDYTDFPTTPAYELVG